MNILERARALIIENQQLLNSYDREESRKKVSLFNWLNGSIIRPGNDSQRKTELETQIRLYRSQAVGNKELTNIVRILESIKKILF